MSTAAALLRPSGRCAIQNASLLPKPPGTRLARPIAWPRKNDCAPDRQRRRRAGRLQARDERGRREQPVEPADQRQLDGANRGLPAPASFSNRWTTSAAAATPRERPARAPAPAVEPRIAAAGAMPTAATASVQPASPEVKAIAIDDDAGRAGRRAGRPPADTARSASPGRRAARASESCSRRTRRRRSASVRSSATACGGTRSRRRGPSRRCWRS